MYGNFLQQSTKKLQDDLRQTMKSYSSEKQQLLRHLASLRHEMDELRLSGSESPTSTGSTTDLSTASGASNKSKSRRFYHAPNIAAHKLKKSRKKMSKHSKRKSETSEEKKQMEGILKLPIIKEGNLGNPSPLTWTHKNSEWDSAQQITLNNLPPIKPPKDIAAAQELLQNDYDMPKIDDPQRSDKIVPTKGKSQEKKRVKFSSKNQVAVFTGETTDMAIEDSDSDSDSKNSHESSEIKPKGVNQRQHYLPPLDLGNRRCLNPQETENHKMLYISIKDPDVRRKTLSEILHAVRMRMQENEHHLRFGEMPRRKRQTSSQESPLNSSQESLNSTDSNKSKISHLGAPQNTAYRMHCRSSNSQLQNYLRKMSRSRRMIEHMEVEEYRLAHIMGHKDLMAVSQQETNSTAA
ncbi:uncharacterized protein LOC125646802 isoform X2 [Ostrea edulis]|nr:uncharacterized protein LOC125646802 isoform X2 [Ostrea edulis]XP_048729297.1 uncharacterized protein LOC125646802 isoform X2 [Ostrea edulis]